MKDIVIETKELEFINKIKYRDIKIYKNETTFITGRSGVGKSSLLRLINATNSPSNGKIYYSGNDISDLDKLKLRKDIILSSQNIYLFDTTIEENFRIYYRYRKEKLISKEDMKKYLEIAASDFNIDANCKKMSTGEKQRVFTAINLSFNPKVILLDEPTSALDDQTSKKFFKNITDYANNNLFTIVTVCHDRSIVERFAERKLELRGS